MPEYQVLIAVDMPAPDMESAYEFVLDQLGANELDLDEIKLVGVVEAKGGRDEND